MIACSVSGTREAGDRQGNPCYYYNSNAKAIQVVEGKLEDIEQMLHKLSLESSDKERTPVP